jgi:PAS domain S-box-containing protein
MTKKPTYKELEKRVKELEKYAAKNKQVGEITQQEKYLSQILLDNIPSVALLIRPETREIVHSNKHAAKIGAIPGKQCFVSWGKSSVPCPWCLAPELWATGKTKRIEVVVSDTVWDTYWVPITEDLYLHYAFDITELRKVTTDIERIFNLSGYMVCIASLDGYFKKISPAFEETLGYTQQELLERPFHDFIHPDDKEKTLAVIREKLEKGEQVIGFENRYCCKDGSYKWFAWSSRPVVEEGITFAIAYDITERKKAENELLKKQYYLSKAQEMGKIGTWELDIKKNILVWTDENYRIFGLPIGTELTYEIFLSCVHPDDREYVDKKWKAAFDKKPYDIEHRLLMNDGSIKWVREKAELGFDEQGEILRGTGFTQDITERKKAEEEIKARQKEIEEINASLEKRVQEELQKSRQKDFVMIQRSRLAAMGEMMQYIIHQWGQPLNALNILFYNLEIALDEIDVGTKEKEVEETIANGLRLVKEMFSTVDDFRNFFKSHKEKVEFVVNKNIKDILSLFGDSFTYSKISVTLKETKELKVRGFPNEFSQVILNILKNAKDAILEKGIKGEINIDILSEDDSVIIRIKDNGGGIHNNILDKVFDSYFTTKAGGDGTGIGLYMSKIIIEEHMDGRISVKNIAGGAELEIALPRFH